MAEILDSKVEVTFSYIIIQKQSEKMGIYV